MRETYPAKTCIIACLLLVVCAAAGQAGDRLMVYSNPSRAAEIDDTARYYHDKYYPQLKLVRAADLKDGDDVAIMVGVPSDLPQLRDRLAGTGISTDGSSLLIGTSSYSRNAGLALRWRNNDGAMAELRTGPYWQAAWTTFYVSSAAADSLLNLADGAAVYFVSYPAYPKPLILRTGSFSLSGGAYKPDIANEKELAADPCGDYQRTMRSSTGPYVTYYYPAGSWAEQTLPEFKERTAKELLELKDYFGMKALKPVKYYLYNTRADKEACTGLYGNAHAMSNAGDPEVFAVRSSTLSATGKHEFVHIFADDNWGRSGTRLLREGLAVQQDGGWHGRPFQYWMEELSSRKALPSLGTLLGDMNYWNANSSDAYAAAGCFADFLLRKFGKEKFREAYPLKLDDATALRLFGQDLSSLEKSWLNKGDAAR